MGFKVSNAQYDFDFIAGDTEYIRLNLRDEVNGVYEFSSDQHCVIGIKRNRLDDNFIIPEKEADITSYIKFDKPYTVEFKFTSDDTVNLLNYIRLLKFIVTM